MQNVSTTQLNSSTFNYSLPNNDDLNISHLLRVPIEIGDQHRIIVTGLRYKLQSYTEKGGFYIFLYNLLSRNYFNNQEFITCAQQAIDGAAYTAITGGMVTHQTLIYAIDVSFTGTVARTIQLYQNDPSLSNAILQITSQPTWRSCVETYNDFLENSVNAFIRIKQQKIQQTQQSGYVQQQPQYGQPPMGYQQPQMPQQYGQQPQMGYQQPGGVNIHQSMVSGQAQANYVAQPQYQQQHAQMQGVAQTGVNVIDPYAVDEPARPTYPSDDYNPYQTHTQHLPVDEISNDGVVYGSPIVTEWPQPQETFEEVMAEVAQSEPVPETISDVCFVPGKYGDILDPERPYSHFFTNGGVEVYSHSEIRRQHIKVNCIRTYDMTREVGFIVFWPNGKTEFKLMPISKETTYNANELFERNKLFREDDFSDGYRALQEFKGEAMCPKDYRDVTDKELQDHEPLTSDIVIEGETDEERDATAAEVIRERDGALSGVVSYHSSSIIPLSTKDAEGIQFLQLAIAEVEDMPELARAVKRLVKDKTITPATCGQIDHRLTNALNSFFRSEVNERIVVDSFIDDIEGLMNELHQTDPDLASYMDEYTKTFINRVLTIRVELNDDGVVDGAYVEEDQLNILLPLHSLNFTIITMQEMFGVCFSGPKHQKVRHLIQWHLTNTRPTRIRLVTSDGVELWASAGMGGNVMLTIDPQHI